MPSVNFPSPQITISNTDARRFLLAHHHLWPPRQHQGKEGVLKYIRHVQSIQFDPINIVGRNPDLVLQSRVEDYKSDFLDQLLYEDRTLVDGWDKMASIHATSDWPNFGYRREYLRKHPGSYKPPDKVLNETLDVIRQKGPVSSLDFKDYEKVDWHWGPTKIVRASMEYLFGRSYLGVHHRVNNRRYFDLIENLLPADLLETPTPHTTTEAYHDWHVQRRLGSLGLTNANTGDTWGGILGLKSKERRKSLSRLIEKDKVIALAVEDDPDRILFMRTEDLHTLKRIQSEAPPTPGAALIAPLDNLMWNRDLIENIFNFYYRWEVYKPKVQREYGYYVLPVLYGDHFVARLDPAFDKKKRILTLQNWWWEADVEPDDAMKYTLTDCLRTFSEYLDAEQINLAQPIQTNPTLEWMKNIG
jgi:uncharacterized protein YcaQ